MNRIEKVLQNDDSAYIYFVKIFKTFVIFLSFYLFSILEKNSIHEILDKEIFTTSKYYQFSIVSMSFYFVTSILFIQNKTYRFNFISFMKEDLIIIFFSQILIFSVYFLLNKIFIIDLGYLYLLIFLLINLFITKKLFNFIYNYMINNDIIHKNIMLVGNYKDIIFFIKNKKEKINIFKCCIVNDLSNLNRSLIRSEIKMPVFSQDEDVRSILEYHELGQIWVLENNPKDTEKLIINIIKFSVDILIVDLVSKANVLSQNLLYDKFEFRKYEISKFYGPNLLLKILLDKILSIIFLLCATPILLVSALMIIIEDGFPIIFSQDRTGWDGRRFNVYKMRIFKKDQQNKKTKIDKKKYLKIGKIINKYRIDEFPQFLNILKGDMSIVGPRPHILKDDLIYAKVFKMFLKRNKAAPGLTGWAQVKGFRGKDVTSENIKKRMEHDIWYMNNWSIWLDLYIIFKTFYVIFTKPKR